MEIQEFNNTKFGAGDKVIYKSEKYRIITVDFGESLFGITNNDSLDIDDLFYIRCENCKFITGLVIEV